MIILSVPYRSAAQTGTLRENHPELWIEYRLDLHEHPDSIPPSHLDGKTILTWRHGGPAGMEFLRDISGRTGCLIDIDLDEWGDRSAGLERDRLLISLHRNHLVPDALRNELNRLARIPARYRKIAVRIDSWREMLELEQIGASLPPDTLLIAMGRMGPLQRSLYPHFGSTGTYVSFPEQPTALGQLSITQAIKHRLPCVGRSTVVGGLIGGPQVWDSLGIEHYNTVFAREKIDAVYLPFEVADEKDFRLWLDHTQIPLCGFSVTMPWKGLFRDREAVNLILPDRDGWKTYNTDIDALEQAIEMLSPLPVMACVAGSGAMAEMVLQVLSGKIKLVVCARNQQAAQALAGQYGASVLPWNRLREARGLLINTTPLGMNGETLDIDPQRIEKVIDFPYCRDEETPLTSTCKSQGIACVDGRKFWVMQAERQTCLFLENVQKGMRQ